ncbi:MAG: DUF1501 domain-containing protein [Isosphaeraceae bacterium]|nr:DUF1501 domain-containing protein [Isosphaeraceae bacterium]
MGSPQFGVASAGALVDRRDFLRTGTLAAAGWSLLHPDRSFAGPAHDDRAVILLMLVGGPSQLDTWDPKPDAPAEIRGPFGSIATAVPGVHLCEHLPRSAARMDRLTIIRSMHHEAAPIHETGHQLIQTGRLCRLGEEGPHAGSVVSRLLGRRNGIPAAVMLPGPIGNTGVGVAHGQSAGCLGAHHEPFVPANANPHSAVCDAGRETARTREAYGPSAFGRDCLLARRFVEAGARFVTVNMFESVFNKTTWDCHGAGPFSSLEDYACDVLPTFDRAFAALLDDLEKRGRLESTLVVATGEFGRTPRLNASGGRDHWPSVWSAVLAGGGTRGGQVVGASDPHGAYPVDRPVHPTELLATMYQSLGIDHERPLPMAACADVPIVSDASPVAEVFG